MKKYIHVIKTTFNDSIQYVGSLLFKFVGFIIIIATLTTLWKFLYSDSSNIIKGYTFNQMIWYLLLTELITFGSGSKVATNEIKNTIKSGNIAYQINKPYNYIIFIICKFIADTLIRFILFLIVSIILGLLFAGPIENFKLISLIPAIPTFFLAVLITGMTRILISISAFWVEDSTPFQMVYNKFVLIFGILFPLEMFPRFIQNIIKFTPVYAVSYGPAKLIIDFNKNIVINTLISQVITLIIISILISIIYKKGVKKLNVNGG